MKNFLITYFLLPFFALSAESDPIAVYLTWQRNPDRTMTIQWITDMGETENEVEFRRKGSENWFEATGSHQPMPEKEPYLIHNIELLGLFPDTIYEFRLGRKGNIRKFQTLPTSQTKPIRFLVGGDCYHDKIEVLRKMNRLAASTDPMFVLIGGDIAYAAAKKTKHAKEKQKRWLTFIKEWSESMVTKDGLLIPLIPAIGNHDVIGRYKQDPHSAPFFYTMFQMPGLPGYNVLDFGNYMTLVILDSGHTNEIHGPQTHWLYHVLEEREHTLHKFAMYHIPAWPSVRKTRGKNNTQVRRQWVPIFERFGLTTAFEHHDHAYKRTPLIYRGRIDDARGVLYMGDGAWGVKKVRPPKDPSSRWYLEKTARERYFLLITLDGSTRTYQAINEDGIVFDEYTHGKQENSEAAFSLFPQFDTVDSLPSS